MNATQQVGKLDGVATALLMLELSKLSPKDLNYVLRKAGVAANAVSSIEYLNCRIQERALHLNVPPLNERELQEAHRALMQYAIRAVIDGYDKVVNQAVKERNAGEALAQAIQQSDHTTI